MVHVLIVEEVRAVAEVIAASLRREADMVVVGCATNLMEAGSHLTQCDVVLINAALRPQAHPPLIRTIRQLAPRVKVLVMGLAHDQHLLLPYILAGVAGYTFKNDPFEELLKNIRMTHNSDVPLELTGAGRLMPHLTDRAGLDHFADQECGGPEALTRREWEVLSLIQQGQTNQEIARALVIELGTAKNHVHNILRKLKVNSRRDAAHVSQLVGLQSWKGEKTIASHASHTYQAVPTMG
jgi:DNA-binding NarL/FixJ family response regulator